MNQYASPKWTMIQQFAFRTFSIYLILYFILLSGFARDPLFNYLNPYLETVYSAFANFAYKLFFHQDFKGIPISDSSLTYTAMLSFFLVAIVFSSVWTITDKGRKFPDLFKYIHAFARYYLVYVLFVFAIDKLVLLQFSPGPSQFLQPVGSIDPHMLFWIFMGASKSYQFFGGLMETIALILLLFRRTSTIGALISLSLLINVLMLDIGYDTLVKVGVFHLLLCNILILIPDIKRLFQFFFLEKNTSVSAIPPIIESSRYKWLRGALKVCLIGYAMVPMVYSEREAYNQFNHPSHINLVGLYKINEFSRSHFPGFPVSKDSINWKQISVNNYLLLTVQFSNDSIANYSFEPDTLHSLIILKNWDWRDSTFTCKLHYSNIKDKEWRFGGIYKNDSISFITTKTDIYDLPLLKEYGKVKWEWH